MRATDFHEIVVHGVEREGANAFFIFLLKVSVRRAYRLQCCRMIPLFLAFARWLESLGRAGRRGMEVATIVGQSIANNMLDAGQERAFSN
ncbi:MAG TPA: hypothetical protein VHT03_01065 [Rhizomicrobium sp.]|jgi:hypothetical protein|nr:hypothetical protein [Rhizomicrobium sp.]